MSIGSIGLSSHAPIMYYDTIDPLGRPTVAADSDIYLYTHVVSIRTHFYKSSKIKQNTSANNVTVRLEMEDH